MAGGVLTTLFHEMGYIDVHFSEARDRNIPFVELVV